MRLHVRGAVSSFRWLSARRDKAEAELNPSPKSKRRKKLEVNGNGGQGRSSLAAGMEN